MNSPKLLGEAREEVERVAALRASIPTDKELAEKHSVPLTAIRHIMWMARKRKALENIRKALGP